MTITKHPMGSADAAWYRMDQPTNRMVINSVLTFEEPLDFDAVRTLLAERLVAPFPRFRQVVVDGGTLGGGLHWEDAARFDLDLHIHRRALHAPGDRATLQELVGDLMAARLDPDKPLWDVYVVDGYGAGSALVVRMHHCIGDGIALARVLFTLTDAPEGAAVRDQGFAPSPPPKRAPRSPLHAAADRVRSAAGLGRTVAGTLVHESVTSLLHPQHLVDLGREALEDAGAMAALLGSPRDEETVLKHEHGVAQRVAWTPPLPLADVKAAAHGTGTTVNDVLMASLAGGFARYLAAHDEGRAPAELHAMVPFNLRPLDEPVPTGLGNRFGLILLGLPLATESPIARLHEVHRRMNAIKSSRQPAVSYATLVVAGVAPAQVETWLIDFMSAKSTAVVTNVPGPYEPVLMTGVPISEVLVWAPCASTIGMSVSLFSYRDAVTIGFMTHADLVPAPDALGAEVVAELEALREAAQAAS